MIRRLLVAGLAGYLLAGCTTMQTEAPIDESRAAATTTPATTVSEVSRTPADSSAAPSATATSAKPATASGTATAIEQPMVETRPLPTPVVQPAVASTGATPGASMARADITTPGAHKDPTSPLAQRVIYFDFDSAVIDARFQPLLEAHAAYLKANPGFKVILQGHTDERGSREYNLALGQRRAESVRQAISLLGVPDGQMEAVSLGEEKPAVEGHDESAWKMNRRTEIHYVGE